MFNVIGREDPPLQELKTLNPRLKGFFKPIQEALGREGAVEASLDKVRLPLRCDAAKMVEFLG